MGRYGNDQLNFAIVLCALVFGLLTVFTKGIADLVFSLIQWMLLVTWALRAFSKNHYNRQKENQSFLRLWSSAKKKFSAVGAFFTRVSDREHKYFKCPNCKARLRVPKGRGEITVTCPCCRNRFDKKS